LNFYDHCCEGLKSWTEVKKKKGACTFEEGFMSWAESPRKKKKKKGKYANIFKRNSAFF
jgi:hypothetical protein